MLRLLLGGLNMTLSCRLLLCRRWAAPGAPAPAVVAHVVNGPIVHNDGLVHVNIGDAGVVYVYHGAVVKESAAPPFTADEAIAAVTISIIYPAIETDMGTPVTAVPTIVSVIPSPVARRPEHANRGR